MEKKEHVFFHGAKKVKSIPLTPYLFVMVAFFDAEGITAVSIGQSVIEEGEFVDVRPL